jgi:hypothetical protein
MSGGPVMEDEVFAGVFEGVDEGVCRVPLEADPEGAKPVRYTLNSPRSIYASRKGRIAPRISSGFVTCWFFGNAPLHTMPL